MENNLYQNQNKSSDDIVEDTADVVPENITIEETVENVSSEIEITKKSSKKVILISVMAVALLILILLITLYFMGAQVEIRG